MMMASLFSGAKGVLKKSLVGGLNGIAIWLVASFLVIPLLEVLLVF